MYINRNEYKFIKYLIGISSGGVHPGILPHFSQVQFWRLYVAKKVQTLFTAFKIKRCLKRVVVNEIIEFRHDRQEQA